MSDEVHWYKTRRGEKVHAVLGSAARDGQRVTTLCGMRVDGWRSDDGQFDECWYCKAKLKEPRP